MDHVLVLGGPPIGGHHPPPILRIWDHLIIGARASHGLPPSIAAHIAPSRLLLRCAWAALAPNRAPAESAPARRIARPAGRHPRQADHRHPARHGKSAPCWDARAGAPAMPRR